MRREAWDEFWWNNITGAQVIVSKVVEGMLDSKMVVLKIPSDLPWRYSMRSAIDMAFQDRMDSSEIVIDPIDAADDNPDNLEPGRFVLQRYASSEVCNGYREKSKISIQDYITQKKVIKNRIVWVKGISSEVAGKWVRFCKGFSVKSVSEGLFVLEIQGDIPVSESKHVKCIDFSDWVGSYDVQLFNSFILDRDERYSDIWKRYAATAAAVLCGVDAEVSAYILQNVDFCRQSMFEGIAAAAEMPEFELRGRKESDHVFWYWRQNHREELEYRLWSAQVQVLFPVIELERVSIIGKWHGAIEAALRENEVKQYDVVITDPMDVELGTLCYMMSWRNCDGLYMLYIPNEDDRARIRFLHECRNLLAHVSCCTSEQVAQLLDQK